MDKILENSYLYCRQVARSRAKNFYYSFLVLPREKRDAMNAVYAFMRYCDDCVDDTTPLANQKSALTLCQSELDSALTGHIPETHFYPALVDTIHKFQIPKNYFFELIKGMEMDLNTNRYSTFQELYNYCYKAAAIVGLVTIHIFQFVEEKAKDYAENCGIAFQLTNILRDIPEDLNRGRIYLPQEDLIRFHCSESDLKRQIMTLNLRQLMEFEVNRAQEYYAKSLPLIPLIHASARPCLIAMMKIYGELLFEIRKRKYNIFNEQIRLPAWKKIMIGLQALRDGRRSI